jgi:LPXTG-motif cell wall-anchored protein
MEFKDEAGNVLLTHGTKPAEVAATDDAAAADDAAVADDAAATDAAATDAAADTAATDLPKTGAESFAAIYGLGAALLGSGAVVLRRKQK